MSAPTMPAAIGAATVAEIREMLGGLVGNTDRALLVRVNQWARTHGWETGWSGPTWQSADRLVGVDFEPDDVAVKVTHRLSKSQPWPLYVCKWYPVASVREAVDTLVMLGVLPAELSSLYAAGRADRAAEGPSCRDCDGHGWEWDENNSYYDVVTNGADRYTPSDRPCKTCNAAGRASLAPERAA